MMNINFNTVLNTLAAKAKALALNVTEIELKVLEATNEEPWGPHGKDMSEIARAAEDPEKYNLIMNVLSERLQMRDENWRLCYKALLLLEFMVKHGPWRVVEELNRSVSSLERLRDEFEYKDPQGRDQGINVRQRAGELASLVCNMDRVRQEREKAARNATKFKGVGSSDVRGGFGSGNYSSGGNYSGYSGFGGGFGSGGGGSGRSQGYGSTESVHVPSSHQNRSTFSAGGNVAASRRDDVVRAVGSGVGGGGVGGGGGGEEAEDPFEATRKRIERLKAEGALPESATGAAPPGLVDPAAANAKVPKKLSDVKINPAVAATFASISIPSSNSAGNLGKLAPPPAPGGSVKPLISQPGSSTSLDLFAESRSDPVPVTQQPSGSSSALDWDVAFGGAAPSGSSDTAAGIGAQAAPAAAAAAQDPFAVFEVSVAVAATAVPAAARSAAPAPSSDFGSMVGAGGPSGGAGPGSATARPPVRPALALEDFADLGDPKPAPGPAVAQTVPTFTAPSAAPPAADPFAALATSSSTVAPGRPMSAAKQQTPSGPGADSFDAFFTQRAAPIPAAAQPPKPTAAATPAPLGFDAFGLAAPPPPARTPQPSASSDPFGTLASSSAPAPPPMGAPAARAPPSQPPAAAAAPFDPFSPAAAVGAKPAVAATPAFDAFVTAPAAAPAASHSFDAFFGASSPGQNGSHVPNTTGPAAAGDPFGAPSRPPAAFPPPPAPAAGLAMNRTGAAPSGHKKVDPFAGLGF